MLRITKLGTVTFLFVARKRLRFLCLSVASVAVGLALGGAIAQADSGTPTHVSNQSGYDTFFATTSSEAGFYTGQGHPLRTVTAVAPTKLVAKLAQIEGGSPNVKAFGFQFRKDGAFINCLTEVKTADEWGLTSIRPSYQAIEMPLYGTQCTDAVFSSGSMVVNSISATNTNTSAISTEVYWVGFGGVGFASFNEENPYYSFTDGFDQQYSSGFNSQTFTRFTALSFSGTNASVQYFLEETEIDTTRAETNPTLVRLQYAKQPDTQFSGVSGAIDPSVFGTSTEVISLSALTNGTYDLLITFANQGTVISGVVPFPESYIYATISKSGSVITLVGTVEYYDGTVALEDQELQPCGITALSGCITNAFSYLFVPSEESALQMTQTFATLEEKAPFVYFYQLQTAIVDVWSSPSELPTISVPFGSSEITLLSAGLISAVPFVSTVRNIIGALIWLLLGLTIYRRTLKIFDNQTAV